MIESKVSKNRNKKDSSSTSSHDPLSPSKSSSQSSSQSKSRSNSRSKSRTNSRSKSLSKSDSDDDSLSSSSTTATPTTTDETNPDITSTFYANVYDGKLLSWVINGNALFEDDFNSINSNMSFPYWILESWSTTVFSDRNINNSDYSVNLFSIDPENEDSDMPFSNLQMTFLDDNSTKFNFELTEFNDTEAWVDLIVEDDIWYVTMSFDDNLVEHSFDFSDTDDQSASRRMLSDHSDFFDDNELQRSLLQSQICQTLCGNVEVCDELVDDAIVSGTIITSIPSTYQTTLSSIGNGEYCNTICANVEINEDEALVTEACNEIKDILSTACQLSSAVNPNIITVSCIAVAIRVPIYFGQILAACEVSLLAYYYGCKITDSPGGPTTPSYFDLICDSVDWVSDELGDLLNDDTITYSVSISANYPDYSSQSISQSGLTFGSGKTNIGTIQFGETSVELFFAVPSDPEPYESYIVYTTMLCASESSSITLVIVGTDGYTDSNVCYNQDSCTLYVPGAVELVVDTVTLTYQDAETLLQRVLYLIF